MKVDAAETFLRDNGFRVFRVRHHDDRTARIELGPVEFQRMFDNGFRAEVVRRFKELGYVYVTIDLQGFRSGSMNEVVTEEEKKAVG